MEQDNLPVARWQMTENIKNKSCGKGNSFDDDDE